MPPILTTERLTLRAMKMDDWPNYEQLMLSDRSRFMGGPFDRFNAWGLFCQDVAQWQLMDHGALMIDDSHTGECLGQVGINNGPLFPEHELGWFVYAHAEGRGIAFEAACAFRDWAKNQRCLPGLVSYMDPENKRSASLAMRMGATLDIQAPRPDPQDIVYRHFGG
ncbi:GNAT family N-acetyltransferase [uncultured Roseibium sp.]|uniref:GNAT family N-acetyltransferase n=1 Tax=uncultured Roseibium sp. TaxID=1936171 RepID=UPI002618D316|nr:GNAT family N-acetyltransferase [uncultured Roseibium sp.]